ncbi:hypothetical protein ABW20_dc0104897 [Dactylellina cionopaga]|nr:hypothetical protein ABW20_dc0104897 [Dactylellina cionopaga]
MRFITFLLTVLLALGPSFTLAEYYNNAFTAPLAGDIVTAGKFFQVRWINLNGGIVNLVLARGDPANLKTIGAIAAGIPNSGVFNWLVPAALEPGDDYAVAIQSGTEKNYTPMFKIIAAPVPVPAPVQTNPAASADPHTSLVEKTTDAGPILTESYPIDPTSVQTETAIVTSDTSLIFPIPTEGLASTSNTGKIITLDASRTYSLTTVTYATTLATVVNGSSTTYTSNGTMTTSSLVTPTEGSFANHLAVGAPAALGVVLAGLMILI